LEINVATFVDRGLRSEAETVAHGMRFRDGFEWGLLIDLGIYKDKDRTEAWIRVDKFSCCIAPGCAEDVASISWDSSKSRHQVAEFWDIEPGFVFAFGS
jgi:hypothetical protein